MSARWQATADVLVIGSGVAGLSAAREAARLGLRALVVTKGEAGDGNTRWAQGGVAAVLPDEHDPGDSVRRHVDDTLRAGAGLCDAEAVEAILSAGPDAVRALRADGARFDTDGAGRLARTREGGHSAYRIIRAGGDATGAEVERALLSRVDGQVTVLEHQPVAGLLRSADGSVAGAEVGDADGGVGVLRAGAVVLATGGLGQLYQATSNPGLATADGIALALRAGADVADLEFVQFHPTVLYTGAGRTGSRPLVTEAVRGEGAVLVDATGRPVMTGVHPLGDLAPRDVVAGAIASRLAESPGGVDDHVYLDATDLSGVVFRDRFPTVWAACSEAGIDPATEPIPVAPAAHFGCGGVVTTVDGRTAVRGLYAAGEVARTGLHGANRLGSNSLLEGLVMGARVARAISADRGTGRLGSTSASTSTSAEVDRFDADRQRVAVPDRARLQRAMSRYAGIGRDASGLARLAEELAAASWRAVRTGADREDAALWLAARALGVAAAAREESRGCHVRSDHPERDDRNWRHGLILRLDAAGEPVVAGRRTLNHALEGVA